MKNNKPDSNLKGISLCFSNVEILKIINKRSRYLMKELLCHLLLFLVLTSCSDDDSNPIKWPLIEGHTWLVASEVEQDCDDPFDDGPNTNPAVRTYKFQGNGKGRFISLKSTGNLDTEFTYTISSDSEITISNTDYTYIVNETTLTLTEKNLNSGGCTVVHTWLKNN